MPFVLEHCYRSLEVAFEKVALSLEIAQVLQEREWSTKIAARLFEELCEYFGCPAFLVWQSMARAFEPLISVFAMVAGAEAVADSVVEFEAAAAAVAAAAVEAVAVEAEAVETVAVAVAAVAAELVGVAVAVVAA